MKFENVLEYLEETAKKYPQKTAVDDGSRTFTYQELQNHAMELGSIFCKMMKPKDPVVLLMEKSSMTLAAMFGVVYAGGFYVIVDPGQPAVRMKHMLQVLDAKLIITNEKNKRILDEVGYEHGVFLLDYAAKTDILEDEMQKIRNESKGTDLLYGIFTSGSTGMPKGIVVNHQAVIDFISHFTETFGIDEKDCIGNQAPFDFDVSVKDIYSAITTGATLVLINRELFSTPPKLLDYLCEKKVTNLTWAVSALCLISMLKGLDYKIPVDVKRVMFSGEVMPIKQLQLWQKALPNAMFVNLYGPSEITCNCTYYPITRMYQTDEKIPIGQPFAGRTVFLLDEKDKKIEEAETVGEICVSGESLSDGYYHNEDETQRRFFYLNNNTNEQKRFYRTGDLGYYGKTGLLYFSGRKDFQIKHMGHRIELEEIEKALEQIDGVEQGCCLLDAVKNRLTAFYVGERKPVEIRKQMKEKLPVYMVPVKIFQLEDMPLNKNGKTDRDFLHRRLEEQEK